MKILYYTWHEWTYQDCFECMKEQGWHVDTVNYPMLDYDVDEDFMECIRGHLLKEKYDCIFSFNYYPVLSRIALENQLKYVSWVFDSPHRTLDSITLGNGCNEVFLFDHYTFEKYQRLGIHSVHYLPLAYRKKRLQQQLNFNAKAYEHEVTFLGSLYEEKIFLDQVNYLPPELSGYIDGIIESQLLIHGYDLLNQLFGENESEKMGQYVKVNMGTLYRDNQADIFRDMIRKKMTALERKRMLKQIGERFPLDIYAPQEPEGIRANYLGYVDYISRMPEIFKKSKININISLRSILTGLPLRVIDVLGAGSFLLTNYQPEMSEYFINGEDLVWYENTEDLLEKIAFYLSHDTQREQIAANGHDKAERFFTYENLLPELFRIALQ